MVTTTNQQPPPAPAEDTRSAAGPYSSTLSKAVGFTPNFVRGFVIEAGGMMELLAKITWSAVRHPVGYWGAVRDDMYRTLKQSWLAITLALAGFLVFISVDVVIFFNMVGATKLYGPVLLAESLRAFTMWIDAMVVAGVVGASLTADVGARKVREELDAMQVMGIDPVRELGVPRVVSITLFTSLLSIPSLLVTMVSMQFGANFTAHMSAAAFYSNLFEDVRPISIYALIVGNVLVGLLIGSICCYKGFTASGGAVGLGRAVNQAVVISFVAVWVEQLAFVALLLGLFPELGTYK
jgi:phospholipid/cholesterol/gamma-HCH transport system permease protein